MEMDYIREFDIRLEKEMYYAGETLSGHVILDTVENFKLRAIRVVLRGKAHTEWKVIVSGDRRTVKDDQYFIDDRTTIWGKEKAEGTVPILPRGVHQFPFKFQLPESSLPCSFESRAGNIRYYIKVTIDIPYSSPPQGMKYFTIIGPHIDCMEEQYLKPMVGQAKRTTCCLCCEKQPITLKTQLERSAYVCGESLRVKADIDNQTEEEARLKLKLVQYVEYYIDRGVLGVTKELSHTILEYRGPPVSPHTRSKWDSQTTLVVSTMPPTLLGVCRLMQIYYLLKVNVELEKSGEDLHMHFPITIATVPFRIPNSNQQPTIHYEVASDHAEGGIYVGPEFLMGQVYDGGLDTNNEPVVLYRPVYLTISSDNKKQLEVTSSNPTQKQNTNPNSSSSNTTNNPNSTNTPAPDTNTNANTNTPEQQTIENLKNFDSSMAKNKSNKTILTSASSKTVTSSSVKTAATVAVAQQSSVSSSSTSSSSSTVVTSQSQIPGASASAGKSCSSPPPSTSKSNNIAKPASTTTSSSSSSNPPPPPISSGGIKLSDVKEKISSSSSSSKIEQQSTSSSSSTSVIKNQSITIHEEGLSLTSTSKSSSTSKKVSPPVPGKSVKVVEK